MSPEIPTALKFASINSTALMALLVVRVWSSCVVLKCRRIGKWPVRSICWCARCCCIFGNNPRKSPWRVGDRNCRTVGYCRVIWILDMQRVCRDLREGNIPVQAEWFTPHSDFRLPSWVNLPSMASKLNCAKRLSHGMFWVRRLPLAARRVTSTAVANGCRCRCNGIDPRRHSMVCNGYRLPLRSNGVAGEHVAGVRYRAWQPPSCLHPMIPVDTPLHIDLYDEVAQRAVAGCTYHVSHPGGRAFDTRPINANEAEGRRCQRFDILSHVPGMYRPQDAPVIFEAPTTLDLRHRRWWWLVS